MRATVRLEHSAVAVKESDVDIHRLRSILCQRQAMFRPLDEFAFKVRIRSMIEPGAGNLTRKYETQE